MRDEGYQNCLGNFLATLRALSKIHCLEEAPAADARSLAKTRLSLHEPLSFHIIGPAIPRTASWLPNYRRMRTGHGCCFLRPSKPRGFGSGYR